MSTPVPGRPEKPEDLTDYYCGAWNPKREKWCRQRAGAGTDHKGVGNCVRHGGRMQAHQTHGARELLKRGVAFYGQPVDVSPTEALLGEVRRTAGHVLFLEKMVQEDELSMGGQKGDGAPRSGHDEALLRTRITALRELYQSERKHLTQVCQIALHAGIEERAVRVAEKLGTELATTLGAILQDLRLSAEQMERAPEIVSRHLRVLEGGA